MNMMSCDKVPAGAYWIGDPCYIVPDELWDDVCTAFDPAAGRVCTTVAGVPVRAWSTAHGDGVYLDGQGREYPVDAGLIGIVPVGAWPLPDGLGHVHVFGSPVAAGSDGTVVRFGPVAIDTGWDDDDDDDDGADDPWGDDDGDDDGD